jgi:uncharacterized protein (UPF0335 family)
MNDSPDQNSAPLRAEAARLARAGAAAFDPAGLRFVRALLDRADRHPGGAGQQLRARAAARLERLAGDLARAARTSTEVVRDLSRRGFDTRAAEVTLERGDLVAVRRAARRYRHRAEGDAARSRRLELTPTARPEVHAARRAARRPPPAAPIEPYRAPLAALVTELSLARTRRTSPEAPGPYNGRVVAARLLEVLATLSPRYAHAQLERMHELAALSLLPEPVTRKRTGKR